MNGLNDTTKPSRITRKQKRRWKIADLIANGLTSDSHTAILLPSPSLAALDWPPEIRVAQPRHAVFLCAKNLSSFLLCRAGWALARVAGARTGRPTCSVRLHDWSHVVGFKSPDTRHAIMKTQSSLAQNSEQTNNQEEPTSLGAPATSTALSTLFEATADNLTQCELEYLARMDEHAALQTHSFSETLMILGSLYCNADKLDQPSAQSTAEIFWNLSNQLDHITGLIELAGSKAYRLANPKTEANKKGRCVMGMQNNSVGSSDLRNIMKLGYAVNTGSHCGGYYWQILTDADGLDELENALNNIDAWVADSQAAIGFLLGSADLGDAPPAVIQDIGFLISGLSELQQAVHCANDVVRANALRAITQKANQQT